MPVSHFYAVLLLTCQIYEAKEVNKWWQGINTVTSLQWICLLCYVMGRQSLRTEECLLFDSLLHEIHFLKVSAYTTSERSKFIYNCEWNTKSETSWSSNKTIAHIYGQHICNNLEYAFRNVLLYSICPWKLWMVIFLKIYFE